MPSPSAKPITFLQTARDKWLLIAAVTLFVPLFLLFFQPFGVNNYDPRQAWRWPFVLSMFLIGLVNGTALTLSEFLLQPKLFAGMQLRTFVLRMCWNIFLLASVSFLFYNVVGEFHDWHWSSYLEFLVDVPTVLIFPVGGLCYYFAQRDRLQQLKLAQSPTLFWFYSNNRKEKLGLQLDDLLFLEAEDNYVIFHYREQGEPKRKLLRSSRKRLEAHPAAQWIIRCHRSYTVNLKQVVKAEGNSHGLQLYLNQYPEPIPVSRS
ncbi:MAG: LytTR family transcriptional regulator [Phaeodactylibacter sp.]|nr:LytTR family transcriptional regulator [Phaeodactylibacter sp.]